MVYRRRKRRTRSKRRRRRRLPKGRARNARFVKNSMLAPKSYNVYSTGSFDSSSYNTHLTINGAAALTVGSPVSNAVNATVAISDFTNFDYSELKGNRFILAREFKSTTYKNTKNAPCEFECYKLTPKVCITKALFDEYAVTLFEMQDLVDALGGDDMIDMSIFGLSIMKSKMVRKYFKVIKKKKFCLAPGAEVTMTMNGLKYRYLNGDELHDDANMIARPGSCKFWYIRCTGTMVHDTIDDSKVGTGPVHLDYILKQRHVYYKIPNDERSIATSISLDTIASGEAIVDADHVAAVVAEQ